MHVPSDSEWGIGHTEGQEQEECVFTTIREELRFGEDQMEGFLVGLRRFSRTQSSGTKKTVKISWRNQGEKEGN